MKYRIAMLMAGLLLAATAGPAAAQEQTSPLRVATIVPARVFLNLHETSAQQQRLNAFRERFEADERRRAVELEELRMARDQVRVGTEQWQERHQELVEAVDAHEVWARRQQREAQRLQKQQMSGLFSKIQEGAAEVARQRGIHLVIAEPDIPPLDMVSPEELRMLINSRNVIYAADLVDISEDVVNHMNQQYRDGR